MEKRGKILKWINYFIGSKYSWAFPPYSLNYVESKEFPGRSDGKESPPMQKMWIQSLNWEDPLEEERVTHSSILAWRIPWTEKPGGLQSLGSQRVRHDWATNTCTFFQGKYLMKKTSPFRALGPLWAMPLSNKKGYIFNSVLFCFP